MADLRVDIASEFTGKAAFTKAEKATGSLDKSVAKLGKQLASVFALTKVVAFGKASVKAFAEDEKAVIRLSSSLKNLGLELAAPAVNQYIDNLSKATAVSDDQLRPAFQALINQTGSLSASQKILAESIDISAGSGVALETVARDLAAAYVGQTRGLRKYNLGLSQAQLKTLSFEDAMNLLNKQFSGANAAFLDSYAGKLQALGVAGGEAQEKIGGAILDLAMALSGASDINDLISKIDSLTDKIVSMFDAFQEGIAILRGVLSAKTFGGMKDAVQKAQVDEYNRRMRRDYMKAWEGTDIPKSAKQLAAEKAAEAAAKKREADRLKALKKQTEEEKKRAFLKKAGSLFDMEQIQLVAALKGQLSDEERKRVELQFALITGNTSEAQKLTYELAKSQGLGEKLATFLSSLDFKNNPFASWEAYLDRLLKKAQEGAKAAAESGGGGTTPAIPPMTPEERARILAPINPKGISTPGEYIRQLDLAGTATLPTFESVGSGQGGSVMENYRLNQIELKVTGEGDITNAIAKGLQNQSLSTGNSTTINRRSVAGL